MKVKKIITKQMYDPLHSYYEGDWSTLDLYRGFREAQWNSIEKNNEILAEKLFNLLTYSSQNIPYYRNVVEKNKIDFAKKTIFDDIKKFPILTKDIIRKEFENLYLIKPDTKWYYNTSGGSTGEPIKLIQDNFYTRNSDAIKRLQKEWAGYEFGDGLIKLWGSQKELFQIKEKLKDRFATWIKSVILLNAFSMNEEKMKDYVDIINKKKPKLIVAYTQSINELTNFIKQNNLKIYSPKSIIVSANVLHPHIRENIQTVFGCPVYNRYGSREVGDIACECEKHEGLHISIFTHHVEILNNELQPCKEGEVGDIYITLLSNFTMPLIRYKIGDKGMHTNKLCTCKRGLPLIKEIVGRDNDVFINSRNETIHTGIINMQFYFKDFIKQYQVIQKNKKKLLVRMCLSKKEGYDIDNELNIMEHNLKKIMGQDCLIEFEITDHIQTTKSGKYRYTIREF